LSEFYRYQFRVDLDFRDLPLKNSQEDQISPFNPMLFQLYLTEQEKNPLYPNRKGQSD
jgi:hypothetical protein